MEIKKALRGFTAAILTVTLTFAGAPYLVSATANAEEANTAELTDGDYKYTVNADDTVTITKYTGSAAEVEIPKTLNGKAVTKIDKSAFYNLNTITSITIPDSVTEIGHSAFSYCVSLKSVTIPDSVKKIDSNAFYYCKELTSVTIPDGVTEIGVGAFSDCASLTSVTLPVGVTEIAENTFNNCGSLTGVTLPGSITKIGDYAFYNCDSLTSITVPLGVKEIGGNAFDDCSSLEHAVISDSVNQIGNSAFSHCASLKDITVGEKNISYSSVDGVLFNNCKARLFCYPCGKEETSYVIPDSVTEICNEAFSLCESLKSVTVPDSVTKIGYNAFNGCKSLSDINIPNSVTLIDWYAFADCSSLASAAIPESVTEISRCTFKNCSSLESIAIPAGVTVIGEEAFSGCTALKNVYYGGTREQWNAIDIDDFNNGNDYLTNAAVTYNSTLPVIPSDPNPGNPDPGNPNPEDPTPNEPVPDNPAPSDPTPSRPVPTPSVSGGLSDSQYSYNDTSSDTIDMTQTESRISPQDIKSAVDAVNNGAASKNIKVSDSVTLTIDKNSAKNIDASRAVVVIEKTAAENPDKNIRGTAAKSFTVSNAGNANAVVKLDEAVNGEFANVYKINGTTGKAEFVGVSVIADGKVDFSLNGSGDYVIMTGKYSDLIGDADNDGVLNAEDACEILKNIANIKKAANNADSILDFNKDGKVNAKDVVLLLKQTTRID